ncbi:putative oxidoreductase YcjS [Pseudodesulfovibrio profundus]|uniref:Putative oxidoreductase YcjS n=1 Tax=Pseudodesulfovibrio profundus TaxID=57320 RepID=A0A2C8F9Y3_9BACT|nr:Gfo/Idh/MocA family oxidoreductase [Pseudodesulfovibrio profundus]MBC15931.1 oxidoreductase [Desulfovibrio sp.]SOB59455.1 putative oxidoreductase YcjS [Pseudodesulfovibrio profundus]|tara:strand:+ start:7207 stop:8325 length:1119 start_codon:yes stop_codon:yes gene_type:complete
MLKYAMIGGGPGAFVGQVHRRALALNGQAKIVAGCFSRDLVKTRLLGAELEIDEDRLYATPEELARLEAGDIDFAVVVTSNEAHYSNVKTCLENGINVMCDKPFTHTSTQAQELVELARRKGLALGVSYTYAGYPMVRQMREMIRRGDIGEVRFINCEYPQGWLAEMLETTGHIQASWRADPKRSGGVLSLGDVGSHIEYLVPHVTGLRRTKLAARLDTLVEGRLLDDNGTILTEYEGGAKGMYWYSQAATGMVNGLRLRIFGSEGGLEWFQEDPDHLRHMPLNQAARTLVRGTTDLTPEAAAYSHTPPGHPEGWLLAFANIYSDFCATIIQGKEPNYPTGEDGLRGVRFIEACLESSHNNTSWIDLGDSES